MKKINKPGNGNKKYRSHVTVDKDGNPHAYYVNTGGYHEVKLGKNKIVKKKNKPEIE
jgi:hypothetical protein